MPLLKYTKVSVELQNLKKKKKKKLTFIAW